MSDFPYAERFPVNRRLPEHGRPREQVLAELRTMARERTPPGRRAALGDHVPGDHEHYAYLNDVFHCCSRTSTCCSATCVRARRSSRARSSRWRWT